MWEVVLVEEVEAWYLDLARNDVVATEHVTAAIDLLADDGPALGRPIADRVKGSRHHNMKELRPAGTNIRVLFLFDPGRNAVLLVAGDKTGNWQGWYEKNIPVAEQRYKTWLARNDNDEEV